MLKDITNHFILLLQILEWASILVVIFHQKEMKPEEILYEHNEGTKHFKHKERYLTWVSCASLILMGVFSITSKVINFYDGEDLANILQVGAYTFLAFLLVVFVATYLVLIH